MSHKAIAHRRFVSRVLIVGLLQSAAAAAADPASNVEREPEAVTGEQTQNEVARKHFERGYQLTQAGELEAAILEFELAYKTQPNFSVLYNLAQAYTASGRVIPAINTFKHYLALGGERIPETRRAQVRETIRVLSLRTGQLVLRDVPTGFDVSIDGNSLGLTPIAQPVRLGAGPHTLVVARPGYVPYSVGIQIQPGAELQVHPQLQPRLDASVVLQCAIPNVSASLDGVPVGSLPARIATSAGPHRAAFQRAGYRPQALQIEPVAGEQRTIACALEADPNDATRALLRVEHPLGTRTWIDGSIYAGPMALPSGKHQVRVAGQGYSQTELGINLAPREERTLRVVPPLSVDAATAERTKAHDVASTAMYITGITGTAAGLTALGLYLYDSSKARLWDTKSAQVVERLNSNPASVDSQELDSLLAEENRIRDRDSVALGLAVLGGACWVATAVIYGLSREDEPKLTTSGRSFDFKLEF
jgi:hypothetical protein